VAIKCIPLEFDSRRNKIDEIYEEVALMKTCSSPHIVSCFLSLVVGDQIWIAMEYFPASVHDLVFSSSIDYFPSSWLLQTNLKTKQKTKNEKRKTKNKKQKTKNKKQKTKTKRKRKRKN